MTINSGITIFDHQRQGAPPTVNNRQIQSRSIVLINGAICAPKLSYRARLSAFSGYSRGSFRLPISSSVDFQSTTDGSGIDRHFIPTAGRAFTKRRKSAANCRSVFSSIADRSRLIKSEMEYTLRNFGNLFMACR